MRVIPTYVHGVLDYLFGALLLFAPELFGFAELGGPAVFVSRIIGALIIGQALVTRYELSLVKLLPMPAHLGIDYVILLILAASPWLFGFQDLPNRAWLPHMALGLAGFVLALISESEPRTRVAHEPRHAH